MSDFDRTEFTDLSMIAATHDRRAITVCLEVAPDAEQDGPMLDPAPYGVQFGYGDGETWFSATVHRVAMVVRYEQIVECVDGSRMLKGIFRARLDEPLKADRTLISWFSYDFEGNTWSEGDVIKPLIRDENKRLFVRENLALMLANDVQRHIYMKTATKMKISVKDLRK